MKLKKALAALILFIVVIGAFMLLQQLVMPKFMTETVEGALISEYYNEVKKEHDVLLIGDCEIYENFSPITLWEKFGITSFIRGSAQQLIWQSYYLLEDTLRYEKPDVVVFSVLSMMYNEPQKEAYNRMSIDGMPLSMTKIKAAQASMLPEEELITYIFPFLRYHSRWSELTNDDFKYMFNKDQVSHNGYLMRVDVKPVTSIPKPRTLPDYRFGDTSYQYLDKMTELCKNNGIELVLVKAPSLYPHWYEEWEQQMVEYAEKHDLRYINLLDKKDEIGLDFQTDTYDAGLHLNLAGAEKLSVYFGDILKREFNLEDHRQDKAMSQIWSKKVDYYNRMRDEQYKELKEIGYLRKFNKQKAENK